MAIDSLQSLPAPVREVLNVGSQIITFVSTPGNKLNQTILDSHKTAEATRIAIKTFAHNTDLAKRKSLSASICGLLILPSFILSILSFSKGKIIKSRPVAIASAVAGVLFMIIWLTFRNYPARLVEKALKTLQMGKEDEAIELVARGADLELVINERGMADILLESAFKDNYAKMFMYLSLLSGNRLSVLMYGFLITSHLPIMKTALELGLPFAAVINEECRVPISKARMIFDLGAPADLLLYFAADTDTAKFAIANKAQPSNSLGMKALFAYACQIKDKELMDYVFKELKAVSVTDTIDNYLSWDNFCKEWKEQHAEITDKVEIPPELADTPFESYAYFFASNPDEQEYLDRLDLAQALEYFGINEKEASAFAQLNNAEILFSQLNQKGIRIRKSFCEQMLFAFNQP